MSRLPSPSRDGFALVTGAGRRLGAAFATALAEDGWFVRLHYNRSAVEAMDTAAAIRAKGGRCDLVQAELTAAGAADALLKPDSAARFCSLLVNNASVFSFDRPDSVTAAALHENYAVNTMAPMVLARAFAAQLPEDRRGLIVNLLDQKLFNLNPDFFAYTLSKAALGAANVMLAQALAPRIRVKAIAPGITLPSADQTEAEFAVAQATPPLGHGSAPDDLVAALRYLVSAEAMTGQTLVVDGGQNLVPAVRDVMFTVRGEG